MKVSEFYPIFCCVCEHSGVDTVQAWPLVHRRGGSLSERAVRCYLAIYRSLAMQRRIEK